MPRTAVVVDSTARLGGGVDGASGGPAGPVTGIRRAPDLPGLGVVELDVVVGGVPRPERDVPLEALAATGEAGRATTSRPSPAGLAAAYAAAVDAGASGVVSVHLSGALSGTVDAARLAAAGAAARVEVVDTRGVGGSHLVAALAAAAVAAGGADVRRTADVARAVAGSAATWVSPVATGHLVAGGRARPGVAALGAGARPLLEVLDGGLQPAERVRTTGRLVERLAGLAEEHVEALRHGRDARVGALDAAVHDAAARAGVSLDEVVVVVQHVGAADLARTVAARVVERTGGVAGGLEDLTNPTGPVPHGRPLVVVGELGAVLACHVGPGAVGVAVATRPRRLHSAR